MQYHATPFLQIHVQGRSPGIALDVGSGTGRNSLYLASQGWQVDAIDPDDESIRKLIISAKSSSLPINAVCASLSEVRLDRCHYDLVLANMVLHYLSSMASLSNAVADLKAASRIDGLNIVSCFTDDNPAGTRPFLIGKGGLQTLYEDWKIVDYAEGPTRPIPPWSDKDPVYQAARIAAIRPS